MVWLSLLSAVGRRQCQLRGLSQAFFPPNFARCFFFFLNFMLPKRGKNALILFSRKKKDACDRLLREGRRTYRRKSTVERGRKGGGNQAYPPPPPRPPPPPPPPPPFPSHVFSALLFQSLSLSLFQVFFVLCSWWKRCLKKTVTKDILEFQHATHTHTNMSDDSNKNEKCLRPPCSPLDRRCHFSHPDVIHFIGRKKKCPLRLFTLWSFLSGQTAGKVPR